MNNTRGLLLVAVPLCMMLGVKAAGLFTLAESCMLLACFPITYAVFRKCDRLITIETHGIYLQKIVCMCILIRILVTLGFVATLSMVAAILIRSVHMQKGMLLYMGIFLGAFIITAIVVIMLFLWNDLQRALKK